MRYYIASGLENFKKVQELRDILNARGWVHTYDWTVHGAVAREPGCGPARFAEVAELERKGVMTAEVVIVLLPGGRGTHTELGMALAGGNAWLDDRIVIFSTTPEKDFGTDERTCAFYHHPLVERFSSWDKMIATFLTECGA